MTAMNASGVQVNFERKPPPCPAMLPADPSQLRGVCALRYRAEGRTMGEIAKLVRISRRQLYRDMKAANWWLKSKATATQAPPMFAEAC